MRIETSAIEMVIGEEIEWKDLLSSATEYLKKVISLPESELKNILEVGLVNLLFSAKLLNESYTKLILYLESSDEIVNKYKIQREIRYFFLNADNILDVIDKWSNKFNDSNLRFRKKDRNDSTINKVNLIRNYVVHEGVPSLMYNEFERDTRSISHSDAPVYYFNSRGYLSIEMTVPEVGSYVLNSEIPHIYNEVRRLVETTIDQIVAKFLE
ncbi:hypothetical protein ABEX29_02720 [Brevibacillus porteri]|uniref:hypothetical protein n=1 Tax=Brevibacillus porteri TaxID=2126350 RepID=UPI003D1E5A58